MTGPDGKAQTVTHELAVKQVTNDTISVSVKAEAPGSGAAEVKAILHRNAKAVERAESAFSELGKVSESRPGG